MSKSSELDQKVKLYLIQCMDFDGYYDEGEKLPETTEEKIEACKKAFNQEVGKWLTGKVGRQEAVKEWLQGLPTVCTIAFYNGDILELAKAWGSLPENPTEREEEKLLENYFSFMAAKLLQLFNGDHVPKD